jgi:hypothetical protein
VIPLLYVRHHPDSGNVDGPLYLFVCLPGEALSPSLADCACYILCCHSQLLELQAELELEKSHLEELHSGKRLTTQSQLDSAQQELKEGLQAADEARMRHDEVMTRLT